ncbi:type I restriction endonuclease [Streptomyces sp. NRRL F-5630]|uniref:type I restriction endonuclease n=1 Tax=Streptomyces sp. NRRL F-5630 TaxID=1463864 RepID=UPI003D7063B2
MDRNKAAPAHLFDTARALDAVRVCYKLGLWFHDAIFGRRTVVEFVPPTDPQAVERLSDPDEVVELSEALDGHRQALTNARTRLTGSTSELEAERKARAEAERLIASASANNVELLARSEQLVAQVVEMRVAQTSAYEEARQAPRKVDPTARDAIIHRAQRKAPLNEIDARKEIDRLLRAAGWVVPDRSEINPMAGRGVAVRESTLATGRVDYVLYVDGQIAGVIEAKREGTHLASAVAQNDRCAGGVLKEHRLAVWCEKEPFAFRYAATGMETYFINQLDPEARSREVFAFHKLATISDWTRRAGGCPAAPTFRVALRSVPDLHRNALRPAQFEAIKELEKALALDKPPAIEPPPHPGRFSWAAERDGSGPSD